MHLFPVEKQSCLLDDSLLLGRPASLDGLGDAGASLGRENPLLLLFPLGHFWGAGIYLEWLAFAGGLVAAEPPAARRARA